MSGNGNTLSTTKIIAYTFGCFCIVVCIAVALLLPSLENKSEEWTTVGRSYAGQFLYDKQSIARRLDGKVMVMGKHIISFEWHKMIATREIAGAYYAAYLDTIDCNAWRYAPLRMTYNTFEGKALYDTMEDRGKPGKRLFIMKYHQEVRQSR